MAETVGDPQDAVAYNNARLLDPATGLDAIGGLLTEGEVIAAVGDDLFRSGTPEGAAVVDCGGHCLAPGLVDMRVELGNLATSGRAAAGGGITSMVCLPNSCPVADNEAVVEFVARRARKLGLVKLYTYGAVTRGLAGSELAELGMLADAGAVAFTDATRAIADTRLMRMALSYGSTFGLLIVNHPEEPGLAEYGVMNDGETATRLGLAGIPRQAEVIMVERDVHLAELTGGRLHVPHVSTADALDAISRGKQRGVNVTCDTAPPYFALNETAIGDYRTFAKLSPPLRNEDDRQAVVAGLKNGTIDVIASDHVPRDEESKRLPFAEAAAGGVGLNTLLAISLELYHNGHLGLLDVFRLITQAPADLLNLPAGRLEVGRPADLLVFDPDRGWKVDAKTLLSQAKNSPFDRRPVQGTVLTTVVDGRNIYQLED
ncbi:MAG: dihydroorotase [Rhodospirillales bacterium]